MHITDEPLTDDQSPLDAVTVDYIDSEELTDTATMPEPLADKISHAIEDAVAAVSHKD